MANETGRITVDNNQIVVVDADPSTGGGYVADRGSLAMFDSGVIGRLFIKRGAADTDWTPLDTQETDDWNLDGNALSGANPTAVNEFLGSTNDFDVAHRRNNQEIMRLLSTGLLIGINSAMGGKLEIGAANLGDLLKVESSPNGGAGAKVIRVSRQFKVQTIDATLTALASILVPAGSRIQLNAFIGCNQHGGIAGALGDGADYQRMASVKRLAAGAAVLNGRTTPFTEEDVKSFNAKFVENVNNIDIEVTGGADRNLAWSAHVEYSIFID